MGRWREEMKINLSFGSFLPALTLIFVIAKLMNKVDWSWWWVFAPIWMPIVIAIFFLIGIVALKVWADSY